MRSLVLLLTFVFPSVVVGQQIVSQKEIIRAGITRIGDLVRLADGWTASSTEGFTWDVSPVSQLSTWLLFVNDVQVDLRVLGRQDLNMLPIPITELCQLEFHSQPTVIGGVVAPSGAIHLRTCTPRDGLTIRGVFEAGSTTGDPGPYTYVQESAVNTDRTGPVAHAAVMYGRSGQYLRVTGQTDEHHSTHPIIRERVRTLYVGEKDARIHHRALGGEAFSGRRWGHLRAWITAAQMEDLRFFEHLGLEVPANHNLLLGHLFGKVEPWAADFSVGIQRTFLTTRRNPLSVDASWRQYALRGLLQKRFGHLTTVGLQSTVLRTWGIGMTAHQWSYHLSPFLHLQSTPRSVVDLSGNLRGSFANGTLGWQALGSAHHRRSNFKLTLLWVYQAPAATQGSEYWASLGYRPVAEVHSPILPTRRGVISADLTWQTGRSVRLLLSTGIRRHTSQVLNHYSLQYDPLTTGLQSTPRGGIPSSGTIFTVGGQISAKVSEAFSFSTSGHRIFIAAASFPDYKDVWPVRSMAMARADFTPNPRFSVYGAVRYRGASTWPAYFGAASTAPSLFNTTLPGVVSSDITIQKRFWGERISFSASLRNLFSGPYRTHPAGAPSRLTYLFRLQYAFRTFNQPID